MLATRTPVWDLVSTASNRFLPQAAKSSLSGVVRWQPKQSPFSTNASVVAAMGTYLFTIFAIQALMEKQKPQKLRQLFMVHNFLLSSCSGLLLVLMLEEIVPIVWKNGFFAGICSYDSWTPRLETLYIFNYLFKYWELADTVFLVLKKKPLQFLHVFHHAATACLCFTQLNGKTSVSWVVITLNLTVHVIMYYYYFITTYHPGVKLWWKRYLTSLQISQFLIDLVVVYFASYSYFSATYLKGWPNYGSCAGTEGAAIFGCLLLTSYLLLFIAFYRKTYKDSKQAKEAAKVAAKTTVGKLQ